MVCLHRCFHRGFDWCCGRIKLFNFKDTSITKHREGVNSLELLLLSSIFAGLDCDSDTLEDPEKTNFV